MEIDMDDSKKINELDQLILREGKNLAGNLLMLASNENKINRLKDVKTDVGRKITETDDYINNIINIKVREKNKWYGSKATQSYNKKKELLIKSRNYKGKLKELKENIQEKIEQFNVDNKTLQTNIKKNKSQISDARNHRVQLQNKDEK